MSAEYSASASGSGYTLTDHTEAIAKKRTDRAIEILNAQPKLINQTDAYGTCPLAYALGSYYESTDLILYLIQHGAYLGITDHAGRTVLHHLTKKEEALALPALVAMEARSSGIIKALLDKQTTTLKETALILAISNFRLNLALKLIDLGADVLTPDFTQKRPLLRATNLSPVLAKKEVLIQRLKDKIPYQERMKPWSLRHTFILFCLQTGLNRPNIVDRPSSSGALDRTLG
jgi:hypothetical protein